MFDVTGTAQPIALEVQGVVEVDPRQAIGRPCPECGPHGNKGIVCLLLSWVDCLTCEEGEFYLARNRLDEMLTRARGSRQLDPDNPPATSLERLAPGRWRIRATVPRFLPDVSGMVVPTAEDLRAQGHVPIKVLVP